MYDRQQGELMIWLSNLQEMTGEYEEKKAAYENLAAGLESNMSKLEQVIIPTHPSLHSDRLSFIYVYINVRAAVIFAHTRSVFWGEIAAFVRS